MVRGGNLLASCLRALGGRADRLSAAGSEGCTLLAAPISAKLRAGWIAEDGGLVGISRLFSTLTENNGESSAQGDLEDKFPWINSTASTANSRGSGIGALEGLEGLDFGVARKIRSSGSKSPDDRYDRAGRDSSVAHILKLVEAASTTEEVEQVLEERKAEFSRTGRWPWILLLEALQKGRKKEVALEVFNWKKDKFGAAPKEYAKMISIAGKMGLLDVATRLYEEMQEKGLKRDPITVNALISANAKNDRADQAIALFNEMLGSDDCRPTLVTYNTLIAMFAKTDVREMERYYALCKESGFHLDRFTFNSMLWGFVKAGQIDRMEETYEELIKTGCRPDPVTFSALISGYSQISDGEKMEKAYLQMKEEGYRVSSLVAEIMVDLYARNRQFQKMEAIVDEMDNIPGRTSMYVSAVESYAETRRIEDMERVLSKMLDSGRLFSSSKSLEAVITAYGEKYYFDRLESLLARIKSLGWLFQRTTFHTLIFEYGKARLFEKMEKYVEEMEKTPDAQPTGETFRLVADSYHAAGDAEMVRRTGERMRAAGFDPEPVLEKEVDRMWTDAEIFDGKRR